jgi:hypothetical protein
LQCLRAPIHQDLNPTLTMLLLLNPLLGLAGTLFVAFGAAGPLVAAADTTTMVNQNFYTEEELSRNLNMLKTSNKGRRTKSAKCADAPSTAPTMNSKAGSSAPTMTKSSRSSSTKCTQAPPSSSCVAGSTGVFVTRADGASKVVEVSKVRPGDKIRGMDASLKISNECEVIANDGEQIISCLLRSSIAASTICSSFCCTSHTNTIVLSGFDSSFVFRLGRWSHLWELHV